MQATKIREVLQLQEVSEFFTAVFGTYGEMADPFAFVEPRQVEDYQVRLKAGWAWQGSHADTVTPADFARLVLEPQLGPRRNNGRCGCASCNAREEGRA